MHKMKNSDNQPRIYVGTYAKYNNGSIEGQWLDLSDYSSKEEFYEACAELHKDETDPEFMFQDWENIPAEMVGESFISDDFFEVAGFLSALENFTPSELVQAHNIACQETSHSDDEIFDFDDDFFDTYFHDKPMEAERAASFGCMNWGHEFITFNGYGNLETISERDVKNHIDESLIIEAYKSNPDAFSHLI